MELTSAWWSIISQLRNCFTRERTFFWGFLHKPRLLRRSDSVRSLHWDKPHPLSIHVVFFLSTAIKLPQLTTTWVHIVFTHFNKFLVRLNGRSIVTAHTLDERRGANDEPRVGVHKGRRSEVAKQEAGNEAYRQGVGSSILCVPLFGGIHLGTKLSVDDTETIFDKALRLFNFIPLGVGPCYLVADAYYPVKSMLRGVLERGYDLITRVKTNAVAYLPAPKESKKRRGRPKKYGKKIKLMDFFLDLSQFTEIASPILGDNGVMLKVLTQELLSRNFFGMTLKYVLVVHPTKGKAIFMTTDLSLSAEEVIRTYSYRFKIEVTFKSAIHSVGTFLYRFWMSTMDTKLVSGRIPPYIEHGQE